MHGFANPARFLRIARWLTPDKRWIHDTGLEPDVSVTIPADPAGSGEASPSADPDDSWRTAEPLRRGPATAGPRISLLEDGGTMLWHQEPLAVGRETTLRFEVRGPDGQPLDYAALGARLEQLRGKYAGGQVELHIVGFAKVAGDLIDPRASTKKKASAFGKASAQSAMSAISFGGRS